MADPHMHELAIPAMGAMILTILAVLTLCAIGFGWRAKHPLKKPWPPLITQFIVPCNVHPTASVISVGGGSWAVNVECSP